MFHFQHCDYEKQQADKKNATANATLVSKHPSTIMIEQYATNSKKLEMEAKHDLELERIKNKRELQVVNNDQKEKHES